jgi:DNA-binding SARP family transcriptional activator
MPKQNFGKINSLLQYFIIHNNKPCASETVVETLWPDNEYADERKTLHTYIHRLKTILSRDNAPGMDFTNHISILNTGGSYMLKTTDQVNYDMDMLTRVIGESAGSKTKEDIWASLNGIFDLYTDHFLQDSIHDQMVLRIRNKYLRLSAEAVNALLEKLFQLGLPEDVVDAAERYFNVDDVDDGVNYWYIRSLQDLGRDNHASRHFKYVEEKMRDVLDVFPSERLASLLGRKRVAVAARAILEDSDIRQYLDDAHIKAMINDVVNEKMAMDASKTLYTFVQVETGGEMKEVTDAMFASAIVKSLRRNDMYAVLDNRTALILLNNAGEEHFDIIRQRVGKSVSNLFGDMKIDVKMWRAIKVV